MDNENGSAPASSADLSTIVIALVKGVVYEESNARMWNALLNLQARVRDYVSVLGLELILDESEGYAYLHSRQNEAEEGAPAVPRLIARRPLSYPVSLLLALLRKRLAEFDARGGDTRLVMSRDEIADMLRIFLPESSNMVRFFDQIDTHLNKLIDMGFVRSLTGQDRMYEVRRILKAYVDAQRLTDLDQRLAEYQAHASREGGSPGDE